MEFLTSTFDSEELAAMVPDVVELMDVYGIEAAVAFDIARPRLRQTMRVNHIPRFLSSDSMLIGWLP